MRTIEQALAPYKVTAIRWNYYEQAMRDAGVRARWEARQRWRVTGN